ncbi:MAG: VOC family protein [Firmicutes bacterium]|nr:VOC family protein [Bacillota bacterium]
MIKNYHENSIIINQIELLVKDLSGSLDFYTNSLGFQILKKTNKSISFTTDQMNELLIITEEDSKIQFVQKSSSLYHFAILLPTRKALGSFLRHLIKKQIPISGASDHLVSESIYLRDPDGNGIEIACDKDDSFWYDEFKELQMDTIPFDYPGVYYEASNLEPFVSLPQETIIGHLHLNVSNLKKQTIFYKNIIGFEITYDKIKGAVFLGSSAYHHHLALNTWNTFEKKEDTNSVDYIKAFTILYPNCDLLKNTLDALEKAKIEVKETSFGYKTKDFDENEIYLKLKM